MTVKGRSEAQFAFGVGVRAVAVGALTFAAIYLAVAHQLYATTLVIFGLAALICADIARIAAANDRILSQFIDALIAEGNERPIPGGFGRRRMDDAIDRALERLNQARRERERRIDYLQTLTDTVAAALLVVDERGRIELANRAALRLFGEIPALTALGEAPAAALIHAPLGSGSIVRLAGGQAMLAVAAEFSTPDGGKRRLISLQRIAGELDAVELKAWQDLARILAHEMMNSLTPICSLAESSAALLREGGDVREEVAQAVEVIARRGQGLMHFVDRYRAIADLPPPDRVAFSVGDMVARLDRLMQPSMRQRGIAYASIIEPAGLTLTADLEQIEQAVINLLKNAAEAAAGRVALTARRTEDAVVIEIADNGPGISPSHLEAIFVPFFTTKKDGSGVGLSLARQIALAHDGAIDHERTDAGTVFRLTLPAS